MSDTDADRTAAMFGKTAAHQPSPSGTWVPEEEMVALQHAVDALRRSRMDADHRASRMENELAALRLNERILEEELRVGIARSAGHDQLSTEHSQLRDENARLRDEHARLLVEHAQLRDQHAETLSRLEIETRRLRDVDAARAAADAFAADASRDLGEAVSDLIEVRRRCAALDAELTSLRADHLELLKAHETLVAQAKAAEETAERNLVEQRRAHDSLRADAAASHERQLRDTAASHERAMAAAEERVEAAEARVREMSAELNARVREMSAELNARVREMSAELDARVGEVSAQLDTMTQSRDQALAELEKSESAVEVMRQRLRDEIDAHNGAEERRSLLEDELSYLRAEVFSADQTKAHKRGFLGRRPRGSATASRPATVTATPSATKDATGFTQPPVPEAADDDRESVLERRLFGG